MPDLSPAEQKLLVAAEVGELTARWLLNAMVVVGTLGGLGTVVAAVKADSLSQAALGLMTIGVFLMLYAYLRFRNDAYTLIAKLRDSGQGGGQLT